MHVTKTAALYMAIGAGSLIVRYAFGLDALIYSLAQAIFPNTPFRVALGAINLMRGWTDQSAALGSVCVTRFFDVMFTSSCPLAPTALGILTSLICYIYLFFCLPIAWTLAIQEVTRHNCVIALITGGICIYSLIAGSEPSRSRGSAPR